MPSDSRPLLIGCHDVAAVVGAEDAGRGDGDEDPLGVLGSRTIVCRHMPPAPGCHCGPEPCSRRPGSSSHDCAAVGGPEQRGVLDARRTPCRRRSATARGATPGRTPTGAACRRTTGGCRARRRTRSRCRPAPSSGRRRRSAGSAARTSRSTARRTAGRGRPATRRRGRPPSRESADRRPPIPCVPRPRSGRRHPCGCRPGLVLRSSPQATTGYRQREGAGVVSRPLSAAMAPAPHRCEGDSTEPNEECACEQ